MADCRRFESDSDCQLTIIGPADDGGSAADTRKGRVPAMAHGVLPGYA